MVFAMALLRAPVPLNYDSHWNKWRNADETPLVVLNEGTAEPAKQGWFTA